MGERDAITELLLAARSLVTQARVVAYEQDSPSLGIARAYEVLSDAIEQRSGQVRSSS